MNRNEPLKLIGKISAIETFIENFPMNVLDIKYATTYTSIFVFLIDILKACNVDIYDIANRIVSKVFGIADDLGISAEAVYDKINNMDIPQQSKFLEGLEVGVKSIIMALLTSIFTCSATPILKTSNMDYGKYSIHPTYTSKFFSLPRTGFKIPGSVLNAFGHMDINPLCDEGRLFFSIEGGDKYYVKEHVKETINHEAETYEVSNADRLVTLSLKFGPGHSEFLGNEDLADSDDVMFVLSVPVAKTITINVSYIDKNGTPKAATYHIPAGVKTSEIFKIFPKNKEGKKCSVNSIQISGGNGSGTGTKIYDSDGKLSYVYLSKADSYDVVSFWNAKDNNSLESLIWGSSTDCGSHTVTTREAYTENIEVYNYVPTNEKLTGAYRVKSVPDSAGPDSPETIVCYQGIDTNTLCKTNDMNAFLWYVMNRSAVSPQVELNKSMWDSRIMAKKQGVERDGGVEWNMWYNSKQYDTQELLFYKNDQNHPQLFPIVQLRKFDTDMIVQFPAQTYFKPTAKLSDSGLVYDKLRLNSTIYKFNLDYLKNITIFNPKVILYGFYDALLGGAISALMMAKPSINKRETDMKLSMAIKKYIEAEDAEVSDCYFTFSNEEFDEMLRDMLLSKYNARYSGGEVNKAVQYDVNDYIAKIDSVNLSATSAESTTTIMKTLTEVSSVPGVEGGIDYGLDFNSGKDILMSFIWALALPIIRAIFTPQVILLFMINFQAMGVISIDDLLGTNQDLIIRLIQNKIFSLVRSIISYIKDMIAKLILDFFYEVVWPMVEKYLLLFFRERLDAWIELLSEARRCIPPIIIPLLNTRKEVQSIEDVKYAEIINDQKTPETTGGC